MDRPVAALAATDTEQVPQQDDAQWYKDAVIYQLHVHSFCDSNADGIGDFVGLMQNLDYLQVLGINAIWLMPFYPSPLRDDGYDIADYTSIHPSYGSLEDFKAFPDEFFAASPDYHAKIFAKWDEETQTRHFAGIGANDHRNTDQLGDNGLRRGEWCADDRDP